MNIKSHTFDAEADAAYCHLQDGSISDTEEIAPGIIVDRDGDGRPVGVEVLYVSRRLGGADLSSYLKGLVEGVFAQRQEAAE